MLPDFPLLFAESKGQATNYKGKTVVMMDHFPVKDGDILEANIEYTNSDYKLDFFIDIKGSCELVGEIFNDKKGNSLHPIPLSRL